MVTGRVLALAATISVAQRPTDEIYRLLDYGTKCYLLNNAQNCSAYVTKLNRDLSFQAEVESKQLQLLKIIREIMV